MPLVLAFTRVIKDMARGLEIYCDDFQGACADDELENEKGIAYGFATRLLGSKASAGTGDGDKYGEGRSREWIG